MKNIALTLALTILLAACSSGGGSTVVELPNNLTGVFNGTYESQNGDDSGSITLNLAQPLDGTDLTGVVTVDADVPGVCLGNGAIDEGSISGFSASITAGQAEGTVVFQLTFDNENTLTGTYVASDCSNATGAGSITVSR